MSEREGIAAALQFAALVESSDDAIISTDLNGIIQTWNRGAERIFGFTADEIVGKSVKVIIPPERHAEEDEVLRRIRLGEALDHFETVRRRKDGTMVPISLTISPIRSVDGTIVGASKIARDITERKDAEERVARATREAAAANRAKDEFLATLSHEMRTPLNAVLGWSRMLREGGLSEERRAHAVEVIQRNAEAQLRLVEDLLDVSRIITGKFRLEPQEVRLPSVIAAALESVLPAVTAKSIRVENAVDAAIGPVLGDPGRLQQAVWNLLSNAVKFTPRGGSLCISLSESASQAQLEVTDTGQGLAADVIPFIFDRFHQVDSGPRRTHSGLGLGLAIVRHIIELHGGTVTASSKGQGHGAVFTISLPLMSDRREQFAARRASPSVTNIDQRPVPDPVLGGVNVLVIEDDADSRELIATILATRAARVTAVDSAEAAMKSLDQELPDLILSDIEMPTVDGCDFITALRKRGPEKGGGLAAIALTAYARPEDRARALMSGFQIHLAKPVDFNELIAAVSTLAGKPTTTSTSS